MSVGKHALQIAVCSGMIVAGGAAYHSDMWWLTLILSLVTAVLYQIAEKLDGTDAKQDRPA